jgi:hypothetical protein
MTAAANAIPDAATIVGQLADGDRRRVLAAVELGAATLAQAVSATGLPEHRVAKALARLVDTRLVSSCRKEGFAVRGEVFTAAARELLTRPPSTEHDGEPAEIRRVLQHFVRGGRLVGIPVGREKRRAVLDWVAQRFEPGRRYTEREVNGILSEHHDDVATLRRYLVDDDFLDRASGEYWRSGGSFQA